MSSLRDNIRRTGTLCQSEQVHRVSFGTVLGVELSEAHWNANCVGNSPRAIMEEHLPEGRSAMLKE